MTVRVSVGRFDSPMRFRFKHASAARSATDNLIVSINDDDFSGANSGRVVARGVARDLARDVASGAPRGFGEGCPRDYVTGETTAGAMRFVQSHAEEITASCDDLNSLKHWINHNETLIDSNPAAFCAIELALLDLFARRQAQSLESFLALPECDQAVAYTAVMGSGSVTRARLASWAYRLVGFKDFKVKVSGNAELDAACLATIPAHASVRVDANNLWLNAAECIDHGRKAGCDIWALEEPVQPGDIDAMVEIATALDCRIVLDESLYNLAHLRRLPEHHRHRFIANVRVSKCGGILRSIDLANRCLAAGCDVILGAHVGETSVLTRAALTVAQGLTRPPLAREGGYGTILLSRDIARESLRFGRGGILVPSRQSAFKRHGLGVEVEVDRVDWCGS